MSASSPATPTVLRLATAGSVDDGKSTLIGRLLFDSRQTFIDQMEAIERSSSRRGDDYVDLALLTDGLRSEREQGITIDVAYRYFQTPQRKFILADTPGHLQYTRNMVTGASTADLALLLVDARNGVVEQTRRHAYLSALLGIRHFVLCVNKMDLVNWDQTVYEQIVEELTRFAGRMGVDDVRALPISALHGDNVVARSERSFWYEGPALLDLLERIDVAERSAVTGGRFPVQYVIRPQREAFADYRGYAGTVAAGALRIGDEVCVLPSGQESRIVSIDTYEGSVKRAEPPMAVTIRLSDDLDAARGSMICTLDRPPTVARALEAHICWMSDDRPMREGHRLQIKHTTQSTRALIDEITARLDVNTLDYDLTARQLTLNEIGRVRLRLMTPICTDAYEVSRATGAFILIDEASRATVGAGMVNTAE